MLATANTLAIPHGAFQSGFVLCLPYHLFLSSLQNNLFCFFRHLCLQVPVCLSSIRRMQEMPATVFILHHVQKYVCLDTECVELN